MSDPWSWLGLFVLLAYTVEAVTGFGSIVIALSLGALLLPITAMLPVLVPLNIVMSGYLTIRHRRRIDRPTLFGRILPLMTVGTALGYLLRPVLSGAPLRVMLGVLIVGFAGRELWRLRGGVPRPHRPAVGAALMLGAGTTHGLFASGGPLLAFALAGSPLDKSALRATLIAVWFSLNSLLTVMFAVDGSLWPALSRVMGYLPLVLIGIVVGEWLHRRVDELRFRRLVFAALAVTGAALIVPA